MKVSATITSSQNTPTVVSIPVYRPCFLIDMYITVPPTINPVSFAVAVLNENNDPINIITGIYPDGLNVVSVRKVIHRNYYLWIKPESPPGNDITIDFELNIKLDPVE